MLKANFKKTKKICKKILIPPGRAPLLRDEVVRNETREMPTKHARANPKLYGAKKKFSKFFKLKCFHMELFTVSP